MGAAASLFPAAAEADWRTAAEAALRGASLETLASETADGIRIEPVYRPAEGPRALGPDGPWRVIARLDHPDPDEANAQALDDLANGADGLQVVFSGALGAHGCQCDFQSRCVLVRYPGHGIHIGERADENDTK